MHDRLVAKAFDHRGGDAAVDRSDQGKAEPGDPWGEQGKPDQTPAQSSLPSVLTDDLTVRDSVLASNLEDRTLPVLECGEQVVDHILDCDRLGGGLDPARGDHHGKGLDERANDLIGSATRTDHDRGAEFDRGHARRAEYLTDLLSAGQMRGQAASAPQAAQVNDPPHARGPRCVRKILRRRAVE